MPAMDEKQEKKLYSRLEARRKQQQANREEFVKAALTTQQGRDFMYWLLEISHVRANPYAVNAIQTSFNCGEMNIGQKVEDLAIKIAPLAYLKMLTEKEEERLNDNRASDTDYSSSSDTFSGDDSDGS